MWTELKANKLKGKTKKVVDFVFWNFKGLELHSKLNSSYENVILTLKLVQARSQIRREEKLTYSV
jgi:hypothetical protein